MGKGGSEGVAFAWDFARPLGFPPVAFAWVHGRMCCLAVVLSVGCVTKLKKWKNTSPWYFAVPSHKNRGVWRRVEIAFNGCRRVFKRGDSG